MDSSNNIVDSSCNTTPILANITLLNESLDMNNNRNVNCRIVLTCKQSLRTKTFYQLKNVAIGEDVSFTEEELKHLWKSKSYFDVKTIRMETTV